MVSWLFSRFVATTITVSVVFLSIPIVNGYGIVRGRIAAFPTVIKVSVWVIFPCRKVDGESFCGGYIVLSAILFSFQEVNIGFRHACS